MLVNQIFFTPVFLAAFFTLQSVFASVGTVSTREMIDTLKRTIPTAYINSCKLWPAVTAVNFWFVPLEFRALFGGAVAVGWNGYLSFLSQQANKQDLPAGDVTTITAQKPLLQIEDVKAPL